MWHIRFLESWLTHCLVLLIHQYSACYHYFCDLDDSDDSSLCNDHSLGKRQCPDERWQFPQSFPKLMDYQQLHMAAQHWSHLTEVWTEHFVVCTEKSNFVTFFSITCSIFWCISKLWGDVVETFTRMVYSCLSRVTALNVH